MASPWDILELPTTASLKDAKHNYKHLALRVHPGKNPNDAEAATENMVKLQAAFEEVIKQINTRASGFNLITPPTSKPHPGPWTSKEEDPTPLEMAYFKYRAENSLSTHKQQQFSQLFAGEPKLKPAFANPFTTVNELPFSFRDSRKPSSYFRFNSANSHF